MSDDQSICFLVGFVACMISTYQSHQGVSTQGKKAPLADRRLLAVSAGLWLALGFYAFGRGCYLWATS